MQSIQRINIDQHIDEMVRHGESGRIYLEPKRVMYTLRELTETIHGIADALNKTIDEVNYLKDAKDYLLMRTGSTITPQELEKQVLAWRKKLVEN